MLDMHVHILAGVDDGAANEGMTREMIRRARDAGITRMVATPHVYQPQDQMKNLRALAVARAITRRARIPLSMGCELNHRALLGLPMQALEHFCLGPTRCILLELPVEHMLPGWDALVCEMMDHGYQPIIAHPERYLYLQRDFDIAKAMVELGCEMQVDATGLMAPLMSAERRMARKLLKNGMAHYVASDAHRPSDYDTFEKAYRTFSGEWPVKNRFAAQMRALMEEKKQHEQRD